MNTKHLVAAAALALVGSASFAQTEAELQHFGSTQPSVTTRATVRNEVIQARAKGEALVPVEADVAGLFNNKPQATGVTRAEVRTAVLKARADGSLDRLRELDAVGGIGGSSGNAVASTRTRDEVRAEAIAATRAGQAARVQAGH
ncbi:MAG: DUF4148 domain-containing protein [Cytophagales bacterium]|nr:DUF4148 domain-containing protein [Rhizobacter sp.]